MNWSRERIEAMERFVQADRSDPFTLARCKLHMHNGIAGFRPDMRGIEPMPWVSDSNPRKMSTLRQDVEAFYGATAHTEQRVLDVGGKRIPYMVTVYRNQVRP